MNVFSKEMQDYFDKQIEDIEKLVLKTNNFDLSYYLIREKNLIKYINETILQFKRKQSIKALRHYLKEKFYSNRIELRRRLVTQIQLRFYSFLNTINTLDDLNSIQHFNLYYSALNPEKNDDRKLIEHLKSINEKIWTKCEKFIYQEMDCYANCPRFLLENERKILKQRVISIYQNCLCIPYDEVVISQKYNAMYGYLKGVFHDFINLKVNLFDDKHYDKDTKRATVDCLIKANWDYLKYENNNKVFRCNLKRYLCIIGLIDDIEQYTQLIDSIKTTTPTPTQCSLSDINKSFEVLIAKLSINLECNINNKDSNHIKICFLIFSISSLLTNFVQYTDNKKEDSQQQPSSISISFTPQLICSSRERQFLFNFLNAFDTYLSSINQYPICNTIHHILDTYIFKSLIKSYTKVLYDENNKRKIILPFNRIYQLLNQVNPMQSYFKSQITSNMSNDSNNTNRLNSEYVFHSLSDSYRLKFIALFSAFISSYGNMLSLPETSSTTSNIIEDYIENNDNDIMSKVKFGMSSIIHQIKPKDSNVTNINLSHKNIAFIPLEPFSISTHICLCIYGIFSPYPNQSSALPFKPNHVWANLIKDKHSVDFYYFNWQDESNFYETGITKNVVGYLSKIFSSEPKKQYAEINQENMMLMIENNKTLSKFYGRLLAYVLLSRAVFKYHTISLIGYSLGCNVIKYCLKELSRINKEELNTEEIMHNVIMIAGATVINEKNKDMLKVIAGKVVNCYSGYDKVLKEYYNKESIGLGPIKFEGKTGNNCNGEGKHMPMIDNIDCSLMRLDHYDYLTEIPNIINSVSVL